MVDRQPIVVVAPFGASPALAPTSKISPVLGVLARFGRRIILVDSAHKRAAFARGSISRLRLANGAHIIRWVPATLPCRRVGKFFNLLQANGIARRLAKEEPQLVWLYNSYAFEAQVALALSARCSCRVVLELEDWPTARWRGIISSKAHLDLFYLHRLLPRACLVTCVNEPLAQRINGMKTVLLPSVIPAQLLAAGDSRRPFSARPYTLGYFGRLSREKGADVLLACARQWPPGWRLCVTGDGPLQDDFTALAKRHAWAEYLGIVPKERLCELVCQCDAILNPHSPIDLMGAGVFPSKVLEPIASGRLLISTALPPFGVRLDGGVLFYGGSPAELADAMQVADGYYGSHQSQIETLSAHTRRHYSEDGVFHLLEREIPLSPFDKGFRQRVSTKVPTKVPTKALQSRHWESPP